MQRFEGAACAQTLRVDHRDRELEHVLGSRELQRVADEVQAATLPLMIAAFVAMYLPQPALPAIAADLDAGRLELAKQLGADVALAERAGLPGIPYACALAATDKSLMRSAFREHGVPSPDFFTAGKPDGLLPRGFSFPLVVKPPAGAGARGTFRVEGLDDLRGYLAGLVAQRLDVDAARKAIGRLAKAMSCGLEEAAHGVLRIANEHMARALRVMSVARGHDPREYGLFCFGGAGAACLAIYLLGADASLYGFPWPAAMYPAAFCAASRAASGSWTSPSVSTGAKPHTSGAQSPSDTSIS